MLVNALGHLTSRPFLLINMDTKNWKVITTDEAGEPILKYDPHRDETVNVITGEVVQGH